MFLFYCLTIKKACSRVINFYNSVSLREAEILMTNLYNNAFTIKQILIGYYLSVSGTS